MADKGELVRSPLTKAVGWPIMALLRWLGVAVGFVLFIVFTLVITYQIAYGERIVLGTRVLDMDLGALSREEAHRLLAGRFEAYSNRPLSLRLGDRGWEFTPKELGVRYDVEESLAVAYRVGREGSLLENLDSQFKAYRVGRVLPVSPRVDEERQRETFSGLGRVVDKPAINASLALQGTEVAIVPGKTGYEFDREALAKALVARFAGLSSEPINLLLVAKEPAIKGPEMEGMRRQLQQLIDKPVTLRFAGRRWFWYDSPVPQDEVRTWAVSRERVVSMLRLEAKGGSASSPAVVLEIDREKAAAYGKELAKEIDQEPRNARLQWRGGVLTPTALSQERRRLDIETFVQRLRVAITSTEERSVEMPVIVEKPAVAIEDVARMGIKELVEERSTSYSGSIPERAHNIRLGAARISGVVVPPGGVFSFNEAVGEVSEGTGYQLGFSIIAGETVADPGGGVCQVSTTVFQAAFWAGYPIVERYPHDYRIRRYEPPPGLDATVYPPEVDFKFRNNTNSYLLVQVRTDESRIYVAIYSTKPGWQVTIREPLLENIKPADRTEIIRESPALEKGRRVVVETPEDGVDVTVIRIVSREGKELSRDRFFSRYKPQRNVVVIGTGPEPPPTVPGRPASSAPGAVGTEQR